VKKALQRQRKALDTILQTAPDADAPPDEFTIDVMCAAMAGAMKSVLEIGSDIIARSQAAGTTCPALPILHGRRDRTLFSTFHNSTRFSNQST
jgi:hypothetical protein